MKTKPTQKIYIYIFRSITNGSRKTVALFSQYVSRSSTRKRTMVPSQDVIEIQPTTESATWLTDQATISYTI